jgi:hypothetical protein
VSFDAPQKTMVVGKDDKRHGQKTYGEQRKFLIFQSVVSFNDVEQHEQIFFIMQR